MSLIDEALQAVGIEGATGAIRNFAIVLIVIIGAILSGIFTAQGIKSLWWRDLKKSKAQPESQIFSIAWLVIYLLLIATVFVAVSNAKNQKEINLIMIALITNMFLQVLWCAVFFGKKNVGTGLIILILTFVAGIWLLYLVAVYLPFSDMFLQILHLFFHDVICKQSLITSQARLQRNRRRDSPFYL